MDGQLTGRVGYRRGLFGRLIPQVEVLKVARPLRAPPPPGVKRKPEVYAVWRDAVPADVLALGQMAGCTSQTPPERNPRAPEG